MQHQRSPCFVLFSIPAANDNRLLKTCSILFGFSTLRARSLAQRTGLCGGIFITFKPALCLVFAVDRGIKTHAHWMHQSSCPKSCPLV